MTRAVSSHSQGVCPCVYDCPEEDTRVYAVLDVRSGGDLGTAFLRRFAQSCGVKGTSCSVTHTTSVPPLQVWCLACRISGACTREVSGQARPPAPRSGHVQGVGAQRRDLSEALWRRGDHSFRVVTGPVLLIFQRSREDNTLFVTVS